MPAALILMLMAGLILSGCSAGTLDNSGTQSSDPANASEGKKLQIVTTLFPQYDFARQIAGDKAEVKMLLKPGEESHSYEPTPQDIIAIQNCDLFIYVGGENDAWVEDILDSVSRDKMKTLRLVDCVNTVEEQHVEGMKEERQKEHEEEHAEETEYDEHVWTSPQNAMKITERIFELLCELDEKDTDVFQKNESTYRQKLEELDAGFQKIVDESPHKTLLFGDRFPFLYFTEEYGLKYYAAFPGCASDTEPSAATMAFLINKVKDDKIPVVLKIELSSDNIANAIAEATGTKVKVFYSCHNISAEDFKNGETYLSMMEKNEETLKEALK